MQAMDERVVVDDQQPQLPRRTIGVIGGTGPLGRGLAERLCDAGHQVKIGSREPERAKAAAQASRASIVGGSNRDVCASDLVVVAVPWAAHDQMLTELRDALTGRIVIDAVNPLGFDERGPFALTVAAGSAAQQAQLLLPASTVVGAFHHLSAEVLLEDVALDADVLVVGDERDAVRQVIELVDCVAGLRGVFAGRLRNAGQVEALTANLIAINRRYRTRSGVRVTGFASGSATPH